ncbi:MAG: anti-sigma factor [Acidobacteria bacterium]|nr:anti-sigma factor [Acidobacteriota bacterium]
MTHEDFESIAALDAVGAATPEEEQLLREHLATCATCREARDEFGEAATLLARDLDPVAPPPEVRARIFEAIDADADIDMDDHPDGEVVDFETHRKLPWWLATAAMLFLALWGWREIGIRVAREKLRTQAAEIEQLESRNATLNQQRDKLAGTMSALMASDLHPVALPGGKVAPTASARAFVDPQKQRAYVFLYNLPANPNDKSYQLWILRGEQNPPQSAGVFDVERNGMALLTVENIPQGMNGLAVTLEPKGGGAQPSNAEYYVLGNVPPRPNA